MKHDTNVEFATCENCFFFDGMRSECRRRAPSGAGFAPVNTSDWCGEHQEATNDQGQ